MNSKDLHKLSLKELEEIFKKLFQDYPSVDLLHEAYVFAKSKHGKQLRKVSHHLYIIHPLRMCIRLFVEFKIRDDNLLIATLFHDLVEDTEVSVSDLKELYGRNVASIVETLTRYRDENEDLKTKYLSKISEVSRFLKSDHNTRLIKVLDMLDNMHSWQSIKTNDELYKKLPRWLAQIEKINIPLAKTVNNGLVDEMLEIKNTILKRGIKPTYKDFVL